MDHAFARPRYLALIALILIGALLRFTHADWDSGNQLHPDERAILFVASQMHFPSHLADSLNIPHSPLNPFRNALGQPRQYPYGHLPLYTTFLTSKLLACPQCSFIPPDSFAGRMLNTSNAPPFTHQTYVGRTISALFDTLTIAATFLLARQLFRRPAAALAAAAMTTFAVLHIQNAHFGTVDSALALFVTLSLLFLVRYAQTTHPRDSLIAGVCIGLAIGSKATAILLVLPLLAAHLEFRPRPRLASMETFWLTILTAFVAFALTNPYAILDPVPYLRSVFTQAQVTSSGADWPFTRQFTGTLPLLYPIEQQFRWFLGAPLTLAIYAALLWQTVYTFRTRSRPQQIVVLWVWLTLLTVGVQFVKFPRYFLPATPAMFALAGGALIASPLPRRLQPVLAALVLIPTALYALAFSQMYQSPHPWVTASQWVYRDLPPQTRIISERWDDPLPLDLVTDGTGRLREQHVQSRIIDPFAEPDDSAKLQSLAQEIAAADYIILSSNRLYGVISRLTTRYPLTSAYYHALFSGDLGYVLDRTFSRYPNLFGIALVDDPLRWPHLSDPGIPWPQPSIRLSRADESFTVYDHPLVIVFRNQSHLPAAIIESRIRAFAGQ